MNYKTIISIIAVALTFVGYAPYVYDVFKKKTTPHTFTFFIWALASIIAFALQVLGGAGVGSWSLLSAAIICFAIFLMGLRIGNKNIVRSDVIFLVLSLVALFLWLVIKQPVWSVILITGVEILGFVPTIRKSWNNPYSETLVTYEICVLRHGLSVLALQQINILTALYPIAWTVANLIFSFILIARRRIIKKY